MTATSSVSIDRLLHELTRCKSDFVFSDGMNMFSRDGQHLVFDTRKYYDRAAKYHSVLINVAEKRPYSPFQVELSDLSEELKNELVALPSFELQGLLKAAMLRIFQDLDDSHNEFLPKKGKLRINFAHQIAKILEVDLV